MPATYYREQMGRMGLLCRLGADHIGVQCAKVKVLLTHHLM